MLTFIQLLSESSRIELLLKQTTDIFFGQVFPRMWVLCIFGEYRCLAICQDAIKELPPDRWVDDISMAVFLLEISELSPSLFFA